jgi:purine-binding chemotaxis protein CheW
LRLHGPSLIINGLKERTVDLAKIRKKARAGEPSSKPKRRRAQHGEQEEAAVQPQDLSGAVEERDVAEAAPEEPFFPEAPAEPAEVAAETSPTPAPSPAEPPSEPVSQAGEKLLIFDLALEKYAIPIHDIAQIIDMPPATPVPNGPPFLAGIFSLRGRIVSVIDVAVRLGLNVEASESRKVVVLDLGADHFGLLVDRIDQVVEVNLSSLEPPPEGFKPMAQEFVEGVFHQKGRAVAFLNLPMFLAFEV